MKKYLLLLLCLTHHIVNTSEANKRAHFISSLEGYTKCLPEKAHVLLHAVPELLGIAECLERIGDDEESCLMYALADCLVDYVDEIVLIKKRYNVLNREALFGKGRLVSYYLGTILDRYITHDIPLRNNGCLYLHHDCTCTPEEFPCKEIEQNFYYGVTDNVLVLIANMHKGKSVSFFDLQSLEKKAREKLKARFINIAYSILLESCVSMIQKFKLAQSFYKEVKIDDDQYMSREVDQIYMNYLNSKGAFDCLYLSVLGEEISWTFMKLKNQEDRDFEVDSEAELDTQAYLQELRDHKDLLPLPIQELLHVFRELPEIKIDQFDVSLTEFVFLYQYLMNYFQEVALWTLWSQQNKEEIIASSLCIGESVGRIINRFVRVEHLNNISLEELSSSTPIFFDESEGELQDGSSVNNETELVKAFLSFSQVIIKEAAKSIKQVEKIMRNNLSDEDIKCLENDDELLIDYLKKKNIFYLSYFYFIGSGLIKELKKLNRAC